jgi:hypothetical protein
MGQASAVVGPNLVKKLIRLTVSVIGLVILRKILGSLPMLKNASAIGDTLLSPLVLSYAVVDTVILLVLLDFGMGLGRDIQVKDQRLTDLGKIISRVTVILVLVLAYNAYEVPAACFFVDRTDLINLGKNTTATNVGDFMRLWGQMVSQMSAAAVQNATGDALIAYQRLAVAVFRQPPNIYAWTFLFLIAVPVVGLVPLITRNLDNLTELLAHAATAFQRPAQTSGPAVASGSPATVDTGSSSGQGMSPGQAVDKLMKLKSLLDSGAISHEDFDQQKKKILGRTTPDPKSATQPEDLTKLKALHDAGGLTDDEYELHKRLFLEQI